MFRIGESFEMFYVRRGNHGIISATTDTECLGRQNNIRIERLVIRCRAAAFANIRPKFCRPHHDLCIEWQILKADFQLVQSFKSGLFSGANQLTPDFIIANFRNKDEESAQKLKLKPFVAFE